MPRLEKTKRSLKDYHEILNDEAYQRGSKHYSYLLRHSILSHRDGSLSLNEILHHRGTTQKLKHMRDNCDKRVLRVDKEEVQAKSRHAAIEFLLPSAHLCCDSNKSRCQVGYITKEDYVPGSLVADEDWFTPGTFEETEARTAQADLLDSKNIATFFIRFESGHSNKAEVLHEDFDHTQFPYRYLLHGTNERNLNSIRQRGLLPGGTRDTRKDVHFTLDHTLTTLTDSLRPENDCILVYRIDALQETCSRVSPIPFMSLPTRLFRLIGSGVFGP